MPWNSIATRNTQNDLELSTSAYVTPHRFIGNFSYKFDKTKRKVMHFFWVKPK
jgi:hypothetical protein